MGNTPRKTLPTCARLRTNPPAILSAHARLIDLDLQVRQPPAVGDRAGVIVHIGPPGQYLGVIIAKVIPGVLGACRLLGALGKS